ncbi:hypothetical protein YC2023_077793 [Brassica napus]
MTESTDKKEKEKTPQHGFQAQHRVGELGGSVKPWWFELVEILRHHKICCSREMERKMHGEGETSGIERCDVHDSYVE